VFSAEKAMQNENFVENSRMNNNYFNPLSLFKKKKERKKAYEITLLSVCL
jgi:hypothetical protein